MKYQLLPLEPSDTLVLVDLINTHAMRVVGTRRALVDADGDLRTARYIPGAATQLVCRTADDRIAAHVWWISRPPHVVVEMGLTVHPDFDLTDVGNILLEEVETRARATFGLAPDGACIVLQTTILDADMAAQALLVERGFARVREWVHFELSLAEAPAIDLPEGVTIRPMDPSVDWPAVGAVMDAAFADHWGEMGPQVRTLLEEDDAEEIEDQDEDEIEDEIEDDPYSNSLGLCFVAEANGNVIGSCLCNARTIEWPDSGKLGSLSVLRPYRRSGVGRALTAAALVEFQRRGTRRVITDTDNASFTGANRFYPRFGFRPYRYEHVYEKKLRVGVEWRILSSDDLVP